MMAGRFAIDDNQTERPRPVVVVDAATGDLAPTGAALVSVLASAANTTNATSVKASAGRVFRILGHNAAGALRHLKIYNKASAPTVGTDTPFMTIPLPASASFNIDLGQFGIYLSAGIAYALTTGAAAADTGALTAGDILGLNILYG
jgi:hypothetical protein